jgi:hypothetical protein
VDVTSLSSEARFDDFEAVGTLAGLGRREPCGQCQREFLVSSLLRSPDGALCLSCDLEAEARDRARSARWDVRTLSISCALLSVSSIGVPWAVGVASVPRPANLVFMGGAVILASMAFVLMVGTMRELRFDLGTRDPILLGKHMFTLAFAAVVNALNTGIFVMTGLAGWMS